MRELTRGLHFPEGPVALDDGAVLVVEIESGTVCRVEPDGSRSVVADCGGGPNGAAFGPDGALYVCNDGGLGFMTEGDIRFPFELIAGYIGGCVQRVDLDSGAVDELYTHCGDDRIQALNDIVFDRNGWFYFVDTGAGALYYAHPDGSSIRRVAASLEFPNGMGLSPDGRVLYAAETYSGRLYAWDVADDGELHARRVFHQADGHGWDGLAVDGAGNVCAANLQASGITIVGPDGNVRQEITVPAHDPYVTNVCFGGADLRTAYVTSSGRGILYATDWPFPGLRLQYAR